MGTGSARHRVGGRMAVVTTGMAVLAACGQGPDAQPPAEEHREADPGLTHVHGLGIDPADGVLYAARRRAP